MLTTFSSFKIGSATGLADHAPIFCEFTDKIRAQQVFRNRCYGDTPKGTPVDFTLPSHISLSPKFAACLRTHDVDSALRHWSKFAEEHLQAIWHNLDPQNSFTKGRGTIRIDRQHVWPHSKAGKATPLHIRRMWKHCCRMVQVRKQPYGELAKRTWEHARDALQFLNHDEFAVAAPLLAKPCGSDSADKLLQCFDTCLTRLQTELSQKRIMNWKLRLQNNVKAQHSWIRQETTQQQQFCFKNSDGKFTASISEQFESVRIAWATITDLFKHSEPDHDTFFQQYGRYITQFDTDVSEITCESLCQTIISTPDSASGLDGWAFKDLKLLASYTPEVFTPFVQLLRVVETTGKWPQALVSGFCSLIPKTTDAPLSPLDLRPITVLSALYRIWARMRAKELTRTWQEGWIVSGAFGGRSKRGAEALIYGVMSDLEASSDTVFVGGLSFDLVKAFDRIPHQLLGEILTKMHMPELIRKPYAGMLRQATRRYKLATSLDYESQIYGGIIQGCPLSMMAMNAVTNIWMRLLDDQCSLCMSRSYVDDLSITSRSSSKIDLVNQIQTSFQASDQFVQAVGGQLNKRKSFSFGHDCLKQKVHVDLERSHTFRLVGGSIAYRHATQSTVTALELSKLGKWTRTVKRCRHIPIPWHDRCQALLRTRSQFTWGAGTHKVCLGKTHEDTIIKSRSAVMRCLLRRDHYIANPTAYFALLTSPSLNPLFSRIADGLITANRVLRTDPNLDIIRQRFQQVEDPCFDGPASFLRQVNKIPGFEHSVDKMFAYGLDNPGQWIHDVRMHWRTEQFKRLAANRPDFQGVQHGVDLTHTLAYLKSMEHDVQNNLDPANREEFLQNCTVLRLILTGGLFTRSIISRHKKQGPTNCSCSVGGEQTVQHVSWYCAHYQHIRAPIVQFFYLIAQASPCFQFASILTERDQNLIPHVQQIQTVLVQIWRQQAHDYVHGVNMPLPNTSHNPINSAPSMPSESTEPAGLQENGHQIISLPSGGVLCQKCGKHVALAKHRRLKITQFPCKQAHLDPEFWTTTPSQKNNPHSHLDNFANILKLDYDHELAWNLSVTNTSPKGMIKCLRCSTTFAWNNRYNIKKQRKCTNPHARSSTPPRWISERMYRDDFREAFLRVRQHLEPTPEIVNPPIDNPSSSSSTNRPRNSNPPQPQTHSVGYASSSSASRPVVNQTASSQGLQQHGFFYHFDDMGWAHHQGALRQRPSDPGQVKLLGSDRGPTGIGRVDRKSGGHSLNSWQNCAKMSWKVQQQNRMHTWAVNSEIPSGNLT